MANLPKAPSDRGGDSEGRADSTKAVKSTKSKPTDPRKAPAKSSGPRSPASSGGPFGSSYSDSKTVGAFDESSTFDKIGGLNAIPRHQIPVKPAKAIPGFPATGG